jgi:uncharacterized protein (TIGR02679 family)
MAPRTPELLRYLRQPALARLWPAARERLERLGRVGGTLVLAEASEDERRAVANLLGLATVPPSPLKVPLGRLDRALRGSGFAVSLPEALRLLDGPLRNRPAERDAERRRREALWSFAAADPLVAGRPALAGWLRELRETGLLLRLAGDAAAARELLEAAIAVLRALPGEHRPPLRQGVLASRVLGSSHALDPPSPVATLVLKALAHLAGRPAPRGAADRRALWATGGVVLDELSSHVLALGLVPGGNSPLARGLRPLAEAGEPARCTLRQLGSRDLASALPEGLVLHVCENPVVVAAAADRLGRRCPPLVCLEGQPSQAACELLAAVSSREGRILYHGDFDWGGLRIASVLGDLVPWRPWRFEARDYEQALADREHDSPLAGTPADSPWDPDLARRMAHHGIAIEEEEVLEELLGDLGA